MCLGQVLKPGIMHVPIINLDFTVPASGLPPIADWLTTFRSIVFSGLQLDREPLDIAVPSRLLGQPIGDNVLRIVKGYTRATAAMFVLLATSELDFDDPEVPPALEPLHPVLRSVWLVPVVINVMDDVKSLHFKNMELSLKGSERQRPNIFAQTMRFIDIVNTAGQVVNSDKLNALIDEYSRMPAIATNKKWQIGKDAKVAINNIASGVAPTTMTAIKHHLNHWKWTECGARLVSQDQNVFGCQNLATICDRHVGHAAMFSFLVAKALAAKRWPPIKHMLCDASVLMACNVQLSRRTSSSPSGGSCTTSHALSTTSPGRTFCS